MGEKGEDPPAAASADQPESPDKTCDHCRAAIETDDWYPVTSERDDDGSIRLYSFCSEDCRDAWLDERAS